MSIYLLDKAYKIASTNGVSQGRVVVRGDSAEECKLPASANAGEVLGITTHSQLRQGRHVGVRRAGIIPAVTAGAIVRGRPVCVAGEDGRIAECPFPRFTTGTVGANNALVYDWVDRGSFSAALRIALVNSGGTAPFSWSFQDGGLRIVLATSSGSITQTAAALRTDIESDPVLSRLLRVSSASGSSGAGLVAAADVAVSNLAATLNPIGIAEEAATSAGDIINIFLTL